MRGYSGLKEDLCLAEFVPDPGFEAILLSAIEPSPDGAWDIERDLPAMLRPPAIFALYHGFEDALFDRVIDRLLGDPKARARGVGGLDLLAARIRCQRGGTMSREAALLGTPAYSTLAAPLGSVVRRSMEQERLVQIRDERDLDRIRICRAEHRKPIPARAGLADELRGLIFEGRTAALEQRCLGAAFSGLDPHRRFKIAIRRVGRTVLTMVGHVHKLHRVLSCHAAVVLIPDRED